MKDLNLIPKSYLADKKNKVKKTYYSMIILIAGFVFAAGYIVPTIYQMSLSKDRDALQAQVNETSNFVSIENKFVSLKAAVKQREETGEKLSSYSNDVLAMITVLERACPEYLAITNMTTTAEFGTVKIKLKGSSDSEYTIASFVRNLTNEGYFDSIDIIDITKDQNDDGCIFNIDVTNIAQSDFSTYYNWVHDFSISYPKDWEIVSEEESNISILSKNLSINSSPASINISVSDVSSSIDDCIKSRVAKLEESKVYENIFSHKTKLRGIDAYINMYYYTSEGNKYQIKEICVVKNNKLFAVTYKENSLEFSNYSKTIDKILNSLYIK